LLGWDINTEIFAEGFRDKIFHPEIIAALGHALSGATYYLRSCVVNFFAATIAEGALHCFDMVFILKYLQSLRTRYWILRWLPDLEMH